MYRCGIHFGCGEHAYSESSLIGHLVLADSGCTQASAYSTYEIAKSKEKRIFPWADRIDSRQSKMSSAAQWICSSTKPEKCEALSTTTQCVSFQSAAREESALVGRAVLVKYETSTCRDKSAAGVGESCLTFRRYGRTKLRYYTKSKPLLRRQVGSSIVYIVVHSLNDIRVEASV
jgi:hypothetical protein